MNETDPDGDVINYGYDADHRLTSVTYPNGDVHAYAYDALGRVIGDTDTSSDNAESFAYYPSSTVVTDALGHRTEYDYTVVGGLRRTTRIVDAKGGVTTMAYDSNMDLISKTDPLGHTTQYAYDQNGNVVTMTDAAGGITQTAYDPNFNQPTSLQDPDANKTTLSYDAKGDLIETQDAQGNQSLMSYDAEGHVLQSQDPLGGKTNFSYDKNGALASVTDPLGRTTSLTNDAWSNVLQSVDPAGEKTSFSYDFMRNLTGVVDAIGGKTSYGYTPGLPGRLLASVTDANSHQTGFNYDVVGRLNSVTNPLSLSKNFTYDAKGNLTSVTDQNGHTTTFAYDQLDRLTSKLVPANGGDPGGTISYVYDATGNLTSVSHYNGSKLAMTYDADNRVTQVVETLPNNQAFTISYTYDADGNRIGMSTPWGNFTYTYDALNRMTSVTNPQGETFKFSYDTDGRRVSLTYPSSNGVVATYSYDAAGQLIQIMHQKSGSGTLIAFSSYTYDMNGNRSSMSDFAPDNSGPETHYYGYDNLNRLISASHPASSMLPILSETFSYDAVGNRLADARITGYTYNQANELTLNSSFTYTYDNNGNQTQVKNALTGAATSYNYDGQNELVSASMPSGVSANYTYDVIGRRIFKSTGAVTSQQIQHVYDDTRIVAMLDGEGNLIGLLTYGPNIDEPLEIRRGDGTEYFMHMDGLGSIVAHTDINGNVVERIEYEAFGQTIFFDERSASAIVEQQSFTSSPFAFTGAFYDTETGFYYLFQRQTFNSTTGRFGQTDPIGLNSRINNYIYPNGVVKPQVNLYVYAENQPVRYTDPLGLQAGAGAISRPPPPPGICPYSGPFENFPPPLPGHELCSLLGDVFVFTMHSSCFYVCASGRQLSEDPFWIPFGTQELHHGYKGIGICWPWVYR